MDVFAVPTPFARLPGVLLVAGLVLSGGAAILAHRRMMSEAAPIKTLDASRLPKTIMSSPDPAAAAQRTVENLQKGPERERAVNVQKKDILFLAAFFGFLGLLSEAILRLAVDPLPGFPWSHIGAWFPFVAAAADVIEDLCWIEMIQRENYRFASVAAWATRAKFILLLLAFAWIAFGALAATVHLIQRR